MQAETENLCSEKLENNSLILHDVDEELKVESKISMFQSIYSDQSTITSDIWDSMTSKDSLGTQSSFPEANFLSQMTLEGKSIPIISDQMDDTVYERAEKFLDSTGLFAYVIPCEEHRPKKFVKVLSKQTSLEGNLLDMNTSPVLGTVQTSSLLIRRENSPEFKEKSSRFQFSISLRKSTSLLLDHSLLKDFDGVIGEKTNEVSDEEEIKYNNESIILNNSNLEHSILQPQPLSKLSKIGAFSLNVIPGCSDSESCATE